MYLDSSAILLYVHDNHYCFSFSFATLNVVLVIQIKLVVVCLFVSKMANGIVVFANTHFNKSLL